MHNIKIYIYEYISLMTYANYGSNQLLVQFQAPPC